MTGCVILHKFIVRHIEYMRTIITKNDTSPLVFVIVTTTFISSAIKLPLSHSLYLAANLISKFQGVLNKNENPLRQAIVGQSAAPYVQQSSKYSNKPYHPLCSPAPLCLCKGEQGPRTWDPNLYIHSIHLPYS